MFHEHAPMPQRTRHEQRAIALRSAFRLVQVRTERQQKCFFPQYISTTHPEPERQADPVLSAYLPGSFNPCANCASPEHSRCGAPGRTAPYFGYPDAIDKGKMEEVLVQGIGASPDGWRSRPAIAGVSTSLPIANRSAIGSFIRLRSLL